MVAKSGAGCAAACVRTPSVSLLRPDADSADVLCTGAAPLAGGLAAGAARCASALKLPSAEMFTSGEAPCSPYGVAGVAHQPAALTRLQRRARLRSTDLALREQVRPQVREAKVVTEGVLRQRQGW